ncbi:hypothetical protein L1987_37268 [Smallanthus sonchifolius]|uniref:Uncharacterized protein n=1 Tax=Smallanthus sonchifolius TaxID=185202 RepID=A0ACB9HHA4_9ASTR|nr:hypothetical protein L1987_37268 [Smallanthus sonchifolius]
MDIQKCSAYTYVEGTPYLIDGCEFTEECSRCRNSGGFCDDGAVYDVDGLVTKWNFTYGFDTPYKDNVVEIKSSKPSLGVILGVSISMGVVFLVGDFSDPFMRGNNAAVQARTKQQNRANLMQMKLAYLYV